ncbi:hypothetical protein OUZ56_000278 [Daphnia magna]|uniref:Uncharacterized protein n=1 Tax=Daphnia magna TaxID=35525 RepID=A0ABQ9ZZ73_9CRUS|nr:hypothetical protein OUZ56_000278 [Daphnia magna]
MCECPSFAAVVINRIADKGAVERKRGEFFFQNFDNGAAQQGSYYSEGEQGLECNTKLFVFGYRLIPTRALQHLEPSYSSAWSLIGRSIPYSAGFTFGPNAVALFSCKTSCLFDLTELTCARREPHAQSK